jgi:hypothetical protein
MCAQQALQRRIEETSVSQIWQALKVLKLQSRFKNSTNLWR